MSLKYCSSICSQADFDAQLERAGNKVVVVDFFATWCGPCRMIAPFLEETSAQFADTTVFLKVSRRTAATEEPR